MSLLHPSSRSGRSGTLKRAARKAGDQAESQSPADKVGCVEAAIGAQRIEQAHKVLAGEATRFDDAALARAAISALRDASPEVLEPLARLIISSHRRAIADPSTHPDKALVEENSAWIADAWMGVIDAALKRG